MFYPLEVLVSHFVGFHLIVVSILMKKVDKAAKAGAENSLTSTEMTMPYSLQECYSLLENAVWGNNRNVKQIQNNFQYADETCSRKVVISKHKKIPGRNVISLINRWKINSFKTKYVSTTKCICGSHISPEHILLCEQMKEYLPTYHCSESADCTLTYDFCKCLL